MSFVNRVRGVLQRQCNCIADASRAGLAYSCFGFLRSLSVFAVLRPRQLGKRLEAYLKVETADIEYQEFHFSPGDETRKRNKKLLQ